VWRCGHCRGVSSTAHSDRGEEPSSAPARFESLYDSHYIAVSTYVRRRVALDRVDDVVAETFLTAWRHVDSIPLDEAARWWLYRVAYRVVGQQWRGRSRRSRLEARLAATPGPVPPSPENQVVTADELRRVLDASSYLAEVDAEILRLSSWEGMSRDHIAEVLELTPNAVSQRLHRARANLTKHYDRLERRNDRTPAANKGGTP
jgi:RNA polymerase sigma factor (sigma-70 family)